jgi:hypothetical protein
MTSGVDKTTADRVTRGGERKEHRHSLQFLLDWIPYLWQMEIFCIPAVRTSSTFTNNYCGVGGGVLDYRDKEGRAILEFRGVR